MVEYRCLTADELPLMEQFLKNCPILTQIEMDTWLWVMDAVKQNRPDFFLPVEMKDGRIITAGSCYSFNSAWNLKTEALPYWVIGLTRTLGMSPLFERHDAMFGDIVRHFQEKDMTTFFMSRLVSSTITYKNVSEYLIRMQAKIGITRYSLTLEKLISTKEEYERLTDFHKLLAHSVWPPHKKVAIIRQDLAFSERP